MVKVWVYCCIKFQLVLQICICMYVWFVVFVCMCVCVGGCVMFMIRNCNNWDWNTCFNRYRFQYAEWRQSKDQKSEQASDSGREKECASEEREIEDVAESQNTSQIIISSSSSSSSVKRASDGHKAAKVKRMLCVGVVVVVVAWERKRERETKKRGKGTAKKCSAKQTARFVQKERMPMLRCSGPSNIIIINYLQ